MYDVELAIEILRSIGWSLDQIAKRFQPIVFSEDFVRDDAGREKLDGICMQLITIGEALKQIDKITSDALLQCYPGVDWKKAKGMRDFISHHYFDIDHEVVFTVCKEHIPVMTEVIRSILKDLEKENS